MYSFLYLQQFSFSIWFCELDPLVFFFSFESPRGSCSCCSFT